jgi:hypothetical protein
MPVEAESINAGYSNMQWYNKRGKVVNPCEAGSRCLSLQSDLLTNGTRENPA